ncbi:unnamed protein product [Tilletia caries]|nr:unnamed protein product [Tilletia caries]
MRFTYHTAASSAGFELPEGMKLYRGNNASGSSKQRSRLGDDDPALYLSGHDDVMFYHNNNWIPKPLTPDGKRPPDKESYSRHAFKDDSDPSADWSARVAARRDLGDAFGSKKAKATVRAQNRLKIDASHMTAMLEEDAATAEISLACVTRLDATLPQPTAFLHFPVLIFSTTNRPHSRPHNVAYVVPGAALLWFGWKGSNGGSILGANLRAVQAIVSLGGYDDALDIFAAHGVGGMVGNVLTAFFADNRFASFDGSVPINGGFINHNWIQREYQLADSAAGFGYSFLVTFMLLFAINRISHYHFCSSESDEAIGVDLTQFSEEI